MGAAMYRRAWRATHVPEQALQERDRIRYRDEGREHLEQSLEHLVIEGRKRGVEYHLPHEQPALGEGLARFLPACGLDLGEASLLHRKSGQGAGFGLL